MKNKEVWKDIPGYEGKYQASTMGRIRSLPRRVPCRGGYTRSVKERILRPGGRASGHLSVVLGKGNNGSLVHALVMRTFVGGYPLGQEIRHKNGDPTDNRLENLEYGTRTDNILDVFRQGKRWRTLSMDDVFKIRERITAGERNVDIEPDFGVTQYAISNIRCGKCYGWVS